MLIPGVLYKIMEEKLIPDWTEFPIEEIHFDGGTFYRLNSWERWPDPESVFLKELEFIIKLWEEKKYKIPDWWLSLRNSLKEFGDERKKVSIM